jgi:hypothetical protein
VADRTATPQQRVQRRLNLVSPTFCPSKWKHATINLAAGTAKSCCHQNFRKLELDARERGYAFHDTAEDRAERRELLRGERPENCSYCAWIEARGRMSDRHHWATNGWLQPFIEEVAEARTDAALPPSWLELNVSSVCNLECSYCSPLFSSRWHREIAAHGPYPTTPPHNRLPYLREVGLGEAPEDPRQTDAFWGWFHEIYPGLRLLKITGGEPLLSDHTLSLLEFVREHPNPALTLAINSNLCPPAERWHKFLDTLRSTLERGSVYAFHLHPSVDTYGARAEYIRHGLDFASFQANVEDYLRSTSGHLCFIVTLNNLSLGGLPELVRYFDALKVRHATRGRTITFDVKPLMRPEWQSLNLLPPNLARYFGEAITFVRPRRGEKRFDDRELEALQRALGMMRRAPHDLDLQRRNFVRFFREHDRRRNTDFETTFPELGNFWKLCADLDA